MRPTLRWCLGAALLAATWAFAQPFTGTWSGPSGKVHLTQEGQFVLGTLTLERRGGRVHGTVDGNELLGLWLWRGSKLAIVATLRGPEMNLVVEDLGAVTLKRASELKRPAYALAVSSSGSTARAVTPEPAVATPTQALRGGLCAQSEGPGPTWTRRLVFDGRGHLAVGADVAPARRGESAQPRQFWVEDLGDYRVVGTVVSVYLGGEERTCLTGSKDARGRVTELFCGGHLYEATACAAPAPAP